MPKIDAPTEAQEQRDLFRWAAYQTGKYPELRLMFHVPNEGKRSIVTGARMVGEGMKRGVPDICLPVPRGKYHGLFIELKRTRNYRVSADQERWLADLSRQGYKAVMCRGWGEASRTIVDYLNNRKEG